MSVFCKRAAVYYAYVAGFVRRRHLWMLRLMHVCKQVCEHERREEKSSQHTDFLFA